ncbi:potassium channel family protein [Streptomyces sioyaensis]|uniref:potassium channel family protein n=1 Tax=Streptomyces sioyaensis TaxID=67364 RepID=UPI0037D7DC79
MLRARSGPRPAHRAPPAARLVRFEHDGYRDNVHDEVTLPGAAYYATVALSTTGCGDITPVSDGARLTTILPR